MLRLTRCDMNLIVKLILLHLIGAEECGLPRVQNVSGVPVAELLTEKESDSGYGIGNMSQASENAVFIDGVCHKIGRVFIDIPIEDRSGKWIIRSKDKRLEAVILPDVDFNTKHIIGLKSFNEKVMFGRMSGTVVLDSGESITVNEIPCFFEESVDKY